LVSFPCCAWGTWWVIGKERDMEIQFQGMRGSWSLIIYNGIYHQIWMVCMDLHFEHLMHFLKQLKIYLEIYIVGIEIF